LVHNGGHASVADDSGAANPGNITLWSVSIVNMYHTISKCINTQT
jgi:hypothetical protein